MASRPEIEHMKGMGDLERTDSSRTRWCSVYRRAPVQRVAAASVCMERDGLRVTEDSGYQVATARVPETRVPVERDRNNNDSKNK